MFPHRNIHKFTWTSPDGKKHNKIDCILIDSRRHSSILDVRSFRAADSDTGPYLVVVKCRERLAVSKRTAHRLYMERFYLKKLNEIDGKEQYRVEISNLLLHQFTSSDKIDCSNYCEITLLSTSLKYYPISFFQVKSAYR
jgi:hypothetical protein